MTTLAPRFFCFCVTAANANLVGASKAKRDLHSRSVCVKRDPHSRSVCAKRDLHSRSVCVKRDPHSRSVCVKRDLHSRSVCVKRDQMQYSLGNISRKCSYYGNIWRKCSYYGNISRKCSYYLPSGMRNQPRLPRKYLQPRKSVSKASVKSVRCCNGRLSSASGFFSCDLSFLKPL